MNFWTGLWRTGARLRVSSKNGLVRCASDWRWEFSRFEDFDYWLVVDGHGGMSIEGVERPLGPGYLICFPPGSRQVRAWHDPATPLRVFYCHFRVEAVGPLPSRLPEPEPALASLDALLLATLREWTLSSPTEAGAPLRESLLWQLLLRTEAGGGTLQRLPEERVRSLIGEIVENPCAVPGIETLARRSGLSCGHFRRVFRALAGEPPLRFILRHRIERACYYLAETPLPVNQVAAAAGYADVYFFSRQFKKRTGLSPSRWRKENTRGTRRSPAR